MFSSSTTASVSCQDLVGGYPAGLVLHGVSLAVTGGEILGLVGPNGSGKSTLIKTLAGVLKRTSGIVLIDGDPVEQLPDRERARRVAVVPHATQAEFPFTVGEFVAQGRYPHLGPFRRMGAEDERIVAGVIAETDLAEFRERPIDALSGGEFQRVCLARALVQEAGTLLLDEPNSHLDLRYQSMLCSVLRRLADANRAVLCVLHDLNLAARICDRLALLVNGRIVASGRPGEVLTGALLTDAYGCDLDVRLSADGFPLILFGKP